MHEFETEEQQLEALKKWWKENSTSLLLGLSIGLISLGGWNYYVNNQQGHREQASDLFMYVMRQAEVDKIDDTGMDKANQLIADYADTPYASLSSLALAAYEYEKGNAEAALSHLQWVNAHAVEEETRHIARLRLAKILLSQKKYDEVEAWLISEHPPGFVSRYEELKGDLYVAKGQLEQARVAYDKAIKQSSAASRWLQLKRQDLGPSELEAQAVVESPA